MDRRYAVLTLVLSVFWAVVLLIVAVLAVRQVRSGRKEPADFDRMQGQAAGEHLTRTMGGGAANQNQSWMIGGP